jgi:predicted acetylornithine/succinylornithine family transaminase
MKISEIQELEKKYLISTYTRFPVIFSKGKGVYLYDLQGNKYLDFLSGIAVCGLGHSHPKVVNALRNQARKLIHTSNLYYTLPQIKLAKLLSHLTNGMKVFFCNSGAEANEGAIKLARKWGKQKNKYEIITAFNSFHGRTLATITATGQEKYQKGFEPLVPGFRYVPFNDIKAIKESIDEKTVAVMLECIQGEGGVNIAKEEYIKEVRKITEEKNILLIIDEVQTGLGRTGKMFSYQHYEITPDIITLAKSLGGGVPIGAFLAKPEIADSLKPGDHASTFGGNPLACNVGLSVLKFIKEKKLYKNAEIAGNYFLKKLQELKEKYSFIVEVRGKGLILAVELNNNKAKEIVQNALKERLIINAIGENIIRFLPPLIVSEKEIDKAIKILDKIFKTLQ